MKKLSLVVAALMFAFGAKAESEVVAGKTWFYKSDGKTCSWIVANESGYSMYDYAGDLTIPSTLGGFPVTEIGSGAFKWNPVNSVKIPSSVTKIGSEAFRYCSHLTSVTIPQGIEVIESATFANCSALRSVEIPDGVKTIAQSAFGGCSAMTSVTIPSSVTAIGSYAFQGCGGLTAVAIPSGVSVIYPYVFSDCVELESMVIPSSVTTIGDFAFRNCKKLVSASIPPSVTSISATSFQGCDGLSSVAVPSCVSKLSTAFPDAYAKIKDVIIYDGVTSIEAPLFSGCSELTTVTLPPSVTSVSASAFSGLSRIESVTMPSSMANIGRSAFAGCSSLKSITIPEGVSIVEASTFQGCSALTSVAMPTSLKEIADNAFEGCKGLLAMTIPTGVTSIGEWAFYGCSGLKIVGIPDSVTRIGGSAFTSCKNLTTVDLPKGLQVIESPHKWDSNYNLWGMFEDCTGLISVSIPSGVTSIGDRAFFGCSRLASVTIPDSVTSIGDNAFDSCLRLTSVTIPSSVTSIGMNAFVVCSSIASVTIPSCVAELSKTFPDAYTKISNVVILDGAMSIGKSAFKGCAGLTTVTIPDSVTSIGDNAFDSCSRLTSLTIPPSVTSIGKNAFKGCVGLTTVTIPSSVTSIGDAAFFNCSGLRSVRIPAGVTSVGEIAFYGCSSLASVTIPAGVTSIGREAFHYCSQLTSVTIPEGVTSIGWSAFSGCTGLVSVVIPSGLTSIESCSFSGCSGLMSVTIPAGVTNIGNAAFSGCSGLTSVRIPASVTRIEESAFSDCEHLNCVYIEDLTAWCGIKFQSLSSNPLLYAHHLYLGDKEVTELEIPTGVTELGDYTFCGCSELTSVTIPMGLERIGDSVFYNCRGLWSVSIPSSVSLIYASAFSGCSELATLKFPMCMAGLPDTFHDACSSIRNVVICDGATEIANWFFWGCTGLETVEIPSGVVRIGMGAFRDCEGLKSMTIPSSVTEISGLAFEGCDIPPNISVFCGDKERVAAMLTESGYDVSKVQWHYVMPPPVVSVADRTIIDRATAVAITSEVEGAIIHCTTDGSEPTISSPTLKKLTVAGKMTIKALAEYEGMVSEVVTVRVGLGKCESPMVSVSKGTTFSGEGNVITLSCATDGVKIRYTVDGSDPTLHGVIYNGPFTISDTTRIRAIATDHRDYLDSDELNALFVRKWERLNPPQCSMSDGDVFYHSKQEVLLWSEREGVDIRYTLDGSTPTEESPICNGHINVSETVTLKFAAFKTGYLPSETTTIHLTREWLAVADPVISAPESFTGRRTVATIASATEGAHIYYTTDGSTPTTASKVYSGPIEILGTTTIRAIAVKEDWLNSGIVSATVEKVWSIGDALNLSGWPFTCSGSSPWTVCRSESYDGEASMRSGDIMRNETSELHMQVAGSGTLSFWWKASCEWTGSPDVLLYDAGEFFVDGIRRSYIQGFADWVKVEVSVDGTGPHEFVWRYSKDGSDSEGEDCVWLDCVSWTGSPKIEDAVVPSSITGGNEDLAVNGSWVTTDLVERYGEGKDIAFCEMYGSDLSAALLKPTGKKDASGNPLFVWQDYVAGTDPTDLNSLFRVSVEMVDGRPVIKWEPNLNENGACRVYTIYGKYELSDAEWHTPTNGLSRFFKVGVSMPDQGGSTDEEDPQDGEEGNSLLHRWSFNGNLLDSVGGSYAAAVGSVAQGAKEYTLAGGLSGSSYIDLGDDLFPADGSAVTMEMWATMRSASAGWTRIWQFGDMPQGFEFFEYSSYNISLYSENYIGMCWNGRSKFSTDDGEWDNYPWTSFTKDKEAYLSVVYAPNGDGSWTVSYRHIDVASGETINQHSFSTKGSDWSLASVGQSECLLGQALTCWDACANASYNEVRIWNRALSEAEQKAHVAAGPDAVLVK